MNRRSFITLLGGAAVAWPLAAGAQQPARKVHRIGFLWDGPMVFADAQEAFWRGLRDLGYVEGRTLVIEYRWAEGKPERMRELAQELVRLKVDVIVAPSSIYTEAARTATSTLPIVFMSHADPLGSGHVASLARPGGNATGLSLMMTETNVKLLELLKEAIPGLARVAVLWDPATPSHGPGLKAVEAAGPALGLQVQSVGVRSATEYESAFSAMVREQARQGSGPFNAAVHRRRTASRRPRVDAQAAFGVRTATPRRGRRPHELLARSHRSLASRRDSRGQGV